jgi:putative tryptophan/tyrosine transport system substrate-binding protein
MDDMRLGVGMQRRKFITLVGGTIAAWPRFALAQREPKRRVAVLMGGMTSGNASAQAEAGALEDGLQERGWRQGGNLELIYRWPGAELDAVRAAASEIAALKPDLVVSRSTPATSAMMSAGLPTIFLLVADPIRSGFVQNLARPGGNVTGFTNFEASVGGKWIELLKEAAPGVSHVTALFNPQTAPYAENYLHAAQAAAQSFGATVTAAPCSSPAELENAIAAAAATPGGALLGMFDTFLAEHRDVVIAAAARNRLPAIYGSQIFAVSGGLMSYASDYPDIFRRAADYVDRILRGAKPGDLPVQAPAKFTLSVSLKAASAIGLVLPQSLIARADEVIE